MFTFTPLLGAQSTSSVSQSLIELDGGVKVLVDVGWDEGFDTRQLVELERHASTLSFVLLTHATISHLGAYAHCCKHIPIFTQIPVYATTPVIAFGRTLLQDLYSSTPLAATFIPTSPAPTEASAPPPLNISKSNILQLPPTPEEIAKYFSLINPLKYSQPHQPTASHFSPPLEGLTLTAYNSGHTLGGTIWHIQHGMESIVYAVDWHQGRESVIGGAAWFGGIGGAEVIEQLRKPTALVCSCRGSDKAALPGGRKRRDELLLDNIRSSLGKGGTVLIPTDSSGRALELAWVLEKAWQEGFNDNVLKNAKVYMANRSGIATMRHARSLLEWMDESIVRGFEGEDETTTKTHQRDGSKQTNSQATRSSRPFEFKHVKIIESKSRLEKILEGDGPRVILASDLSLDWGLSKEALEKVARNPENLVILTQGAYAAASTTLETGAGLARTLWQWFEERQDGVALEKTADGKQMEQVHSGGRTLRVRHARKAPLDLNEAHSYQQYMATQRQLQGSLVSRDGSGAIGVEDVVDDDTSSSSSEDSDDEHQGRALNVSAALGHAARNKTALSDKDLGVDILLRKKGVYDFDVRNKRGRNAVFPYYHSRKRGDDFGEYIKPEDYLRAEEKEEQENAANSRTDTTLGQKRKWEDPSKGQGDSSRKRQQAKKWGHTKGERSDGVNGSVEANGASESDFSEPGEGPDEDTFDGPAKVLFTTNEISVNARIAFVDCAGLHDQRSLQMLIPLIDPRKLIIVGGSKEETRALVSDCKLLLNVNEGAYADASSVDIFSPDINQTVDASVDTNAWIVKLSRGLVRRLLWQTVRNMGVVSLTGQLRGELPVSEDTMRSGQHKKQKTSEESKKGNSKVATNEDYTIQVHALLDVVPSSMAAATRGVAQPLHVGDLRLADLRRLMSTAGHSAEFRGEGTLLIDGLIAVRKLGTGKIIVEGAPVNAAALQQQPDSFHQVKRKIYEGLAVLAAG